MRYLLRLLSITSPALRRTLAAELSWLDSLGSVKGVAHYDRHTNPDR